MLIAPHGMGTTSNGTAVGVPKAEAILMKSLLAASRDLLPPGRGRELFVLPEVELGVGRPDALLVAVSRSAINARRQRGLRIRTLAEAEILGAWFDDAPSRHSKGHVRSTLARARASGWMQGSSRSRAKAGLVADSMLIEAKVSDWRTGINQLARARFSSHRAVLAMPEGSTHRPSRPALEKNRVGLAAVRGDGGITFVRQPKRRQLSTAADLWLVELVMRAVDTTEQY